MGPPPDPAHVPALAAALADLDQRTGLARIKADVRRLVVVAQANYERELAGEPAIEVDPYPLQPLP